MMPDITFDRSSTLDLLTPLPLPNDFKAKSFSVSAAQQLGIAFMLNILSLAVPIMMLQVYDRIIPHQSYDTLKMLTFGVLFTLGLDAALRIMRAWMSGWAAASSEYAASNAAMDHFARSDISAFEAASMGEHMQNLGALGKLREFYSGQALIALIDLPFALLFIALVGYIGGTLVIVPLALLTIFALCAIVSGGALKHALQKRRDSDDRKSSTIISILSGIHSVKALGMESSLMRQYEQDQHAVTHDSYHVAMASGRATILSAGFGQACLILTATVGALYVINGDLTVGSLSACILLAGRAIQPIQRALGTWLRLQDLSISRRQAQSLFDLPVRAVMPEIPNIPPVGRIKISDLGYTHSYNNMKIFRNLNLLIEPGQVVAISGEKSSGKSTLLQLMAGLLVPSSGDVTVTDLKPHHFNLSRLSDRIGYLPQEGSIFRGTILENMTGFRSDDVSIEKAKIAGAELGLDQVIDMLPYGYQTMLTDSAADPIPPGIKQRISLVRVLMHRPAVLLFDDADRALDKEGYNRLFRLMGRLKGTCTLVIVSHDQNLLSFSDQSYRLENGQLHPAVHAASNTLSILSHPLDI